MRFRSAWLAVVAAAFAVAPATALAAPDREGELTQDSAVFEWTSAVGQGLVYTSDVANRVPACSAMFSCDQTLIKTDRYGNLEVGIVGKGLRDQDTLQDIDLHVFVSNANGSRGEVIAEGLTAEPSETVLIEDLAAGYYLVYVDWYLGAGSFDGTAKLLEPTTPTDTPPEFVPAETPFGAPVDAAREHTFATTADAEYPWTSNPGAGFSDVVEQTGCRTVNCDYSLFKVDEAGVLTISTDGAQTLVDGDLYVYLSNAEGGFGEELASATNFTPDENVALDVEPGYYLVRYQYSGAGSYDGKASLRPPPVEEPDPGL